MYRTCENAFNSSSEYDDSSDDERSQNSCKTATSTETGSAVKSEAGALSKTLVRNLKNTESKRNYLGKLPTRRPDPNTFNRNALMARENRRKKKEYLVKLENELSVYIAENKKLRKVLKSNSKLIEKLNRERSYLRGVMMNSSAITSLVESIKNRSLPRNVVNSSLSTMDNSKFGMAIRKDPFLSSVSDTNQLISIDDVFGEKQNVDDSLFTDIDNLAPEFEVCPPTVINEDHNYFNSRLEEPGICLHVFGDNLSLEFCATCNANAKVAHDTFLC